jgi:hypothetical protein
MLIGSGSSVYTVHFSEGEVGGLQAAAGVRAQARPATFLPHELRQHELTFGTAAGRSAQDFERTLERQMRVAQQQDMQHPRQQSQGSKVRATSGACRRSLGGTAPAPPVSDAEIARARRVRDTLFKAQLSLATDVNRVHTAASPATRAVQERQRALPAASHIDPSLAYLQQLRRREILPHTEAPTRQ